MYQFRISKTSKMKPLEKRLNKLERGTFNQNPLKYIRVIQHENESKEEALRQAKLPIYEQNRTIIFRLIINNKLLKLVKPTNFQSIETL